MHIVHSTINPIEPPVKKQAVTPKSDWALRHQYKAFKKACKKYEADIKEIQETMPEWAPVFVQQI